jgi:hypothetical protein
MWLLILWNMVNRAVSWYMLSDLDVVEKGDFVVVNRHEWDDIVDGCEIAKPAMPGNE